VEPAEALVGVLVAVILKTGAAVTVSVFETTFVLAASDLSERVAFSGWVPSVVPAFTVADTGVNDVPGAAGAFVDVQVSVRLPLERRQIQWAGAGSEAKV
jgi:hypothetical protein